MRAFFSSFFGMFVSFFSLVTRTAKSLDNLASAAELQSEKLNEMSRVDYQLYKYESQEQLSKRVESINKARAKRQQSAVNADDIMAQIKAAAED